jgi:3-oxoacyl-(acyl-carrier-protein) synthase
MALQKVWGKCGVPVVSYKGQVGYMESCCGLLDLMLAADALQQRRLLALTTRYPINDSLQIHVHADSPPLALKRQHILKSGIGLDGSAIAMVISANSEDVDEHG